MGLFRFNIQSKELTKVIDSEFNRLALYQKNDSLLIGGVDGLIKYPIKDFINYKPLKFNSSFDDTYLIIIFLCLVIVMLLILKFNKKTIIIEGAAPNIENQINGFISNNLSNASVIGIQKEFNISYRQLSKIYEPIGPGKKIEQIRKEKSLEMIKNGDDITEITKATGYSVAYLKNILKSHKYLF